MTRSQRVANSSNLGLAGFMTLMAAGLLVFAGCQGGSSTGSDSGNAQANKQLLALGQAYHSFHLSNKKGPASWDEAMSAGDSEAIAALREQGCLVAWGTRFKDATVGSSNFVLAYLPATKQDGGLVLLLDGNVLKATPEGLQELLNAQSEIGVPQ